MRDVTKPRLRRVYVKDVSFEARNVWESVGESWKPEVQLDMNNQVTRLDETRYEVVLFMTVSVKNEGEVAYICEIQQAGIFLAEGLEEDQLKKALGCECPNDLFPYARTMVSNLVASGGYPLLVLAPVDFETLYEQALAEKDDQQS